MQSLLYKDRRNRILYALYERRRNVLLSLIQNISLTLIQRTKIYNELLSLPRESSITRLRNRCSLTGRSRAIYRHFGISRLIFRKLAWQGQLIGVKKASWLYLKYNVFSFKSTIYNS